MKRAQDPHPFLTEKLALMKRPFMDASHLTPEMLRDSNRLIKIEGRLSHAASFLPEGTPVFFFWGDENEEIREGILQDRVPSRKGRPDRDMVWVKVPTGACKVWLYEVEEKKIPSRRAPKGRR